MVKYNLSKKNTYKLAMEGSSLSHDRNGSRIGQIGVRMLQISPEH